MPPAPAAGNHLLRMQRMEQFRASSPQDRVAGDSILAVVEAMGAFRTRALKLLAEHGISDPRSGEWYPLQGYLDALRSIYDTRGAATVSVTGRKLVESNPFPPEIDSLEKALASLNTDYLKRHRGSDVGGFRLEPVGERSVRMVVRNPYPCELDRAVVEAICQRFRPAGRLPRVTHEDGAGCRKDGADACTLLVSW